MPFPIQAGMIGWKSLIAPRSALVIEQTLGCRGRNHRLSRDCSRTLLLLLTATAAAISAAGAAEPAETPAVGIGAKPVAGAELLLDGSRQMLDEKWTYWQGPRFASSLPIKWKIVNDPVDAGKAVMTDDPAADKRYMMGVEWIHAEPAP